MGVVPSPTLAAVTAYADFLRFQALPCGGGTFDQPDWLMRELRIVHTGYTREKNNAANRDSRRAGTKARRGAQR